MAVGDVVNGFSAVSTDLSFQPAVGVECIITSLSMYNTWAVISNGTVDSLLVNHGTATGASDVRNTKICINNTYYIKIHASTNQYTSYSGIQIK